MIARIALSLVAVSLACPCARSAEFNWKDSGAGLAMTKVTNAGPVIYTVVRVELSRFKKDLSLTTALASNTVVGLQSLSGQVAALPKELGTPVAAMNADFFLVNGAAKGDPRGLQILRGELVSTPSGSAAFWQDTKGKLHGERVTSKLTVSWPGGGTNLAGLNEQHGNHSLVLFTPRMGQPYEYRPQTNRNASSRSTTSRGSGNSASDIPQAGPIRPSGGREWTLEYAESGPWLPLRVGQTYHARAVASSDGFTRVPPDMMLLSLGSNMVVTLPGLTNGMPVTITVATEPDLSGVQTALGTGPMLVRDGRPYELAARSSDQLHPRSAVGWNDKYLFLAVADGRQPGVSVGIRLSAMTDFLIALGCLEAINMDGGLSTTLMLNGAIINQASIGGRAGRNIESNPGREREIANAIVVVRKREAEPEDQINE
jgi:hypothetical protein